MLKKWQINVLSHQTAGSWVLDKAEASWSQVQRPQGLRQGKPCIDTGCHPPWSAGLGPDPLGGERL